MEASVENIRGMIAYPCRCGRKVLVYENCRGRSSSQCPQCKQFAVFDFDNMTAVPCSAVRGAVRVLSRRTNFIQISPRH